MIANKEEGTMFTRTVNECCTCDEYTYIENGLEICPLCNNAWEVKEEEAR